MAELVCRALGADGAEHRANHTGVGKLSFEVTRGADRLWARVAATAEEDDALRRWAEHADRLSDRYAAPPVLETLRVDGRTTLVFPFLPTGSATSPRRRCWTSCIACTPTASSRRRSARP
jgi:hypothetical protein